MLRVVIPEREFFDERTNEFVETDSTVLTLEHSLLSLSKWESKWCKPFLGTTNKTHEECVDYIRCMTMNEEYVNPLVYRGIPKKVFDQIDKYIEEPMTATTINDTVVGKKNHERITAEIIYYWMSALEIPFECEKWHLNRLLMLIRVSNIKNAPQKKMSKKDIYAQNRALNEARKKKLGTRG